MKLENAFGVFAGEQHAIRLNAGEEADFKTSDFVQWLTRFLSSDAFIAPKRFGGGNVDGIFDKTLSPATRAGVSLPLAQSPSEVGKESQAFIDSDPLGDYSG